MDSQIQSTILIVDDEPIFCEIMVRFLMGKGYRTIVAHDGYGALAVYEHERPDAVLLDMKMPGMNGLDTLRELKALDPEAVVIMITALAEENLDRKVFAEGAIEYITKPFRLEDLAVTLQRTIGLRVADE